MDIGTSVALTEGIRISVRSTFVPERSSEAEGRFFFVYHVTIENESENPAQLISRHWLITNAYGDVEEVRGPGVVGFQPRLRKGEVFQYTSACPLNTPFGSMRGTYQMVRDDGTAFEAVVSPFTLAAPHAVH